MVSEAPIFTVPPLAPPPPDPPLLLLLEDPQALNPTASVNAAIAAVVLTFMNFPSSWSSGATPSLRVGAEVGLLES
jgi:hypothetical protein